MEHSLVSFIDAGAGRLAVHEWDSGQPLFSALLVHGYGEHLGRYDHLHDACLPAVREYSGQTIKGMGSRTASVF